ncbi:hypothetical protein BD414DRAFT_516262 [Trametes punicea]|nr:hypothetical protein BD414DRAFT_516262 [Trametes punicea]
MKFVLGLVDRLCKTRPDMEVVTTIGTILPLTPDLVIKEVKDWSCDAAVNIACPNQENTFVQAQQHDFVGLYFHGGGYTLGSAVDIQSGIPHGFVKRRICSCVLSLEYTPFSYDPDGPNRSFPLQILEAFDSAGAHLALALLRYLLESKCMPSPRGLNLLSPWCDLSEDAERMQGLLGPLPQQHASEPYFSLALHSPPSPWPPTAQSFALSIATLLSRLRESGALVTAYEAQNILPGYSHDLLIFATVRGAWPGEVRDCWERIKAWFEHLPSCSCRDADLSDISGNS